MVRGGTSQEVVRRVGGRASRHETERGTARHRERHAELMARGAPPGGGDMSARTTRRNRDDAAAIGRAMRRPCGAGLG
jgi:hypothetical protein